MKLVHAEYNISKINARQSLVDTEHQLKELGKILKYANDYQTNKVYNFISKRVIM